MGSVSPRSVDSPHTRSPGAQLQEQTGSAYLALRSLPVSYHEPHRKQHHIASRPLALPCTAGPQISLLFSSAVLREPQALTAKTKSGLHRQSPPKHVLPATALLLPHVVLRLCQADWRTTQKTVPRIRDHQMCQSTHDGSPCTRQTQRQFSMTRMEHVHKRMEHVHRRMEHVP